MIDVQNITKRYGPALAVDDISFQLKKGEILGFLGPNGAGKTTTLRMVSSYLEPDAGKVLVDGQDIAQNSLEARKKIGYMPENNPLYQDLEVEEYLGFIAEARRIPSGNRKKRIGEVMDLCGIVQVRRKNIGELSKGFRQRVGFAQTLLHDPDFLILDEPTSGLDPNQIVKIRELIRELGKEKALIISTHILQEVESSCNRIIIIDRGKIVGQGTLAELTASDGADQVCRASFRAPEAELMSALEQVDCITKAAVTGSPAQGTVEVKIHGRQYKDFGEALFRLAAEKGWVIDGLQLEARTLEDAFRSLTAGREAH